MTDFFTLQNALAAAINADPVLRLAHLTAWLDPLWSDDEDDWDMPQDDDGTLTIALRILRRAFPDIYFEALLAIRSGATYQRLDHLICDAVQLQGIPLENLEWLPFGIPLPTYGASLEDPDFYETHPDIIPVLACFGISPDPNPYNVDIPDVAYKAAAIIADNLVKQQNEGWRQVAWLLRWLFSQSGNSSVDWDDSLMSEVQPLSWEPEDIEFACDIVEEADSIMADALAGLAFINGQPNLMAALQDNVRRIYKVVERQNGRRDEPKVRLKWPSRPQLPLSEGQHVTCRILEPDNPDRA